jgi:hypothetical protein
MDTATVEQRLRTFLLALAGWMCVGTIVELFLAKHTKDPVQFVPFVLCGVGLIAVVAAQRRPRRATLLALRGVMGLLMFGSLFGMYEHLANNFAFELEMRPSAVWSDVWLAALRGAAPLLAPGILALAAIIAIAATYAHPALSRQRDTALPAHAPAADTSMSTTRRA